MVRRVKDETETAWHLEYYKLKLVGMFFHDPLSSGPTCLYCSLAGGLILWADLIYHGLDT